MCSLFDYLANKLSKDKNVDSSVNISDEKLEIKLKLATFPTKQKAFTIHANTFLYRLCATCAPKISLLPFGGSKLM